MYFKETVLFVLVLLIFGCGPKTAVSHNNDLAALGEDLGFDLYTFESVAMVNVDACTSCGNAIKDFFKINENNHSLLVILSSQSRKKCQIMSEGFEHLNIIFDNKQKAIKQYKLLNMQPLIYSRVETKYEKKEYLLSEFAQHWVQP